MIKVENECVNCGFPCLREACRYYAVVRMYCDRCKTEDELYYFEGDQLCADCILKSLERVEYDD